MKLRIERVSLVQPFDRPQYNSQKSCSQHGTKEGEKIVVAWFIVFSLRFSFLLHVHFTFPKKGSKSIAPSEKLDNSMKGIIKYENPANKVSPLAELLRLARSLIFPCMEVRTQE